MQRLTNAVAEMARRGLRQQDVADHISNQVGRPVDRSRVSRILCCQVRARPEEKSAIATLLGLSIGELFPRRYRLRRHDLKIRARRHHALSNEQRQGKTTNH